MSEQLCAAPHDIDRLVQEGHQLCPGHVKALPERFTQLADLHDDLANNLIKNGGQVERTSKSEAVGISLTPAVVKLRDDIRNELAGWARIVCEDRDITYTGTDDVHDIAYFLATHADWISRQEFAADLWTGLIYDPDGTITHRLDPRTNEVTVIDTRALRTQARSLLQPSGTRRMDIGHERCLNVACQGFLIAVVRDIDELLPSKVWCEKCGQEWPAGSWLTLGRKIRERDAS